MVFPSRFMPCAECGGSVERGEAEEHRCDPDRLLDYRIFGMREEIARFECSFQGFVDTREGRFETWVASRTVRRGRP